jgi:hypothetical protein
MKKSVNFCWAWWHTFLIPVLRKLRQEDHEFKTSLGHTVKAYLKKSQLIYFRITIIFQKAKENILFIISFKMKM